MEFKFIDEMQGFLVGARTIAEGDPKNFKITTASDLEIAEALVAAA